MSQIAHVASDPIFCCPAALQRRPQSRREFSTLSDHLLEDVALSPREIRVLRNTPRPAIETVAGDTPSERERLQLVLRDASHSTEAKECFRPARKTYADLEQQLNACRREIDDLRERLVEAMKQQSATSEMLRIISNSPVQSVLDSVAENGARLCDSANAEIFRLENNLLQLVASHGELAIENVRLFEAEKQRTLALTHANRDLQEREATIRRLVDANIIGIFSWDHEGRILEANEAFLQIAGYELCGYGKLPSQGNSVTLFGSSDNA